MTSNNNTDFFIHLEWNKSSEDLLVEWADHAACFTWVYDKSYRRYDNLNNRISVPVIVIGTVVGVLTVGISSLFPTDYVDSAQKVLGGINIALAIAGTIQNKYRWAQLSESHLNAFNEWQKFERAIKVELSIERQDRRPADEFMRIMRHDYEKLMNANPILPIEIISDFKNAFKNSNIIKPEILDSISHTLVFNEKRSIIPTTNNKVSYMKRLASLIPYTKSYKNSSQIFGNIPKTPKSTIYQENRSSTPSSTELSLVQIRDNINRRESITVNTKNLDTVYDNTDEIVVTHNTDTERSNNNVNLHQDYDDTII